MCGCVSPPTPSMPLGSRWPCQWIVVCSGSLLVTNRRTRSPSTTSIVGPGLCPLYPHRCAFMPGASSRTTGSATRWNSLTPSFMRHGSVQPFSVTTALYGRPLGGVSGACVTALSCVGASGSDAAPARVTRPAPAMAAPAVRMNPRRFIECSPRSMRGGARAATGVGARCDQRRCGCLAARQRELEIGAGEPEITLRLDRCDDARDLLARLGQQLEDARQHAVVAEQRLVGDRLAQRHDLVAVMAREIVGGAIGVVGGAHLGARVAVGLGQAERRLPVDRLGLGDFRVAPVEQR